MSDRDFPVYPWSPDPGGRLAAWRENVGRAVSVEGEIAPATPARELVVLSWNVWIGRGRLAELLGAIRDGSFAAHGAAPGVPLVALVQEAYRRDGSVPAVSRGAAARDFSTRTHPEEDIVHVARRLGMHLRYAPSMRNGAERSDRGNAILSTLPLADASGWELPLVLQRRVAVAATVRLPDGRGLRVVSAHLDPRGATARDMLGVLGRGAQARALVSRMEDAGSDVATVLGADLNLGVGRREPAYSALRTAGFELGMPAHPPAWDHTYHRTPRLRLDWLLFRDPGGIIASASVRRLDETPGDTGPFVFHSDHHPLLARVTLADGPEEAT